MKKIIFLSLCLGAILSHPQYINNNETKHIFQLRGIFYFFNQIEAQNNHVSKEIINQHLHTIRNVFLTLWGFLNYIQVLYRSKFLLQQEVLHFHHFDM